MITFGCKGLMCKVFAQKVTLAACTRVNRKTKQNNFHYSTASARNYRNVSQLCIAHHEGGGQKNIKEKFDVCMPGEEQHAQVNARTAYLSWRCVNSLKAVEEMRTSVTLSASQHPVRRSKLSPRAAAKERVQSNGTSLGALHFKSPSLSPACSVCLFWAFFPPQQE